MPLKPHPTDPDKMVFDNKDRIAAIEKLERQEGVCAKCGGIVYDPVIPQLGWQGLTDEEIQNMWSDHCKNWQRAGKILISPTVFGRAIEAKLKEKNHAV